MSVRKVLFITVVMSALGTPAFGQSEVQEMERSAIARMRADVGKHFWIEKPYGKGMELCPSATGRFNECKWIANTSFRVQSIELGDEYLGIHAMKPDGGRTLINR